MNILHILSQVEVTGAETYAVTLADHQIQKGNKVFIISDTLKTPTNAQFFSYPIHNRKYFQRIKNIFYIRKFIKEHQIDIVNTHSRAGSWVAYFALKGTGVPLISTVHGRQHLHVSTSAYDIYGDKVIAVCEHLKTHLIKEVRLKPSKILHIPNAIDFDKFTIHNSQFTIRNSLFSISIIGRTSGPKGKNTEQIILKVLPELLKKHSSLKINIIGGKPQQHFSKEVRNKVATLNHQYNNAINLVGYVSNINEFMLQSTVVIGSGRVAMEALFNNIPTIALGESAYHGLVTNENKQEVMSSNFGDMLADAEMPPIQFEQLIKDLISFFENNVSNQQPVNRNWIVDTFNVEKIAQQIQEVYQSACIQKKHPHWIPVLMYHKIPDQKINSKHKIFITKNDFEKQLQFFKSRGLQPITFKDYDDFRTGKKALKDFPEKPIFLTFDDAYLDNYTNAFPLLKKYGFKGVIYTLADSSITDNRWDVAEGEPIEPLMNNKLKLEMKNYGIEFGSHSNTHPKLTEISIDEVTREISDSKKILEKNLETSVLSFAYPYGKCNECIKELAKQVGYKYAVATDSGGMTIEDDQFQIYRVNVFPNESYFSLYKKTSSWYRKYIKWKYKK